MRDDRDRRGHSTTVGGRGRYSDQRPLSTPWKDYFYHEKGLIGRGKQARVYEAWLAAGGSPGRCTHAIKVFNARHGAGADARTEVECLQMLKHVNVRGVPVGEWVGCGCLHSVLM